MTKSTVERYLKVKALAERGELGERDVAQKMMRQFEAKYEGIAQAAAQLEAERKKPKTTQTTKTTGPTPWSGFPKTGNWENIFRFASMAYETFNGVAETISNALYGRELAEVDVQVKGYKRGESLFIRVEVPLETVHEARSLNAVQKEAFRQALQERVEGYLDAMLEE
jgi:hypothetical protein